MESLELLSRAAIDVQEHEAALELSKLPAKKRLTQLKHHQQQMQQNAINQQQQTAPPTKSSISIIPINQAHSTTLSNSSINSIKHETEPMDQDDDEEINVHDDDSPLDMRITKHDSDSDSVRPSVIRRAPSFKETSNSPSDPTSTCDPFIDEHFRRSLGTDYDLIMRNKMEQEQQLALQKQRMLEEQHNIQQQAAVNLQSAAVGQQQNPQQNILKLKHHKKHQIHQHHQAMLAAKHSQAMSTPPTTPSPPIAAQLPMQPSPNAVQMPIQISPVPNVSTGAVSQKHVIILTEHSDTNEMSVDDHFAKALGETWKQIQNEGK